MEKVDQTVYEVQKQIEVTPMMQLIDLNGTRVNFQSEFTVTVSDPSKAILVAVVNQNQLDNGELNFEETVSGKFARRVTYQNSEHLNYYIALKKMDRDEVPIECLVVIQLKELPPLSQPQPEKTLPPQPEKKTSLPSEISSTMRSTLHDKLETLKGDPLYHSLHDDDKSKKRKKKKNDDDSDDDDSDDKRKEKKRITEKYEMIKPERDKKMEMTFTDRLKYDPYYTASFVCFVLFLLILLLKFIKK
jgi:hypothetical protein